MRAGQAFDGRVRALMPRSVMGHSVNTLFRHFPERLPEFRARALPLRAMRIALDLLCCGALLASLWVCRSPFLAGRELLLLRHAGTAVVAAGVLADLIAFGRMAGRAWKRTTPGEESPEGTDTDTDAQG